MKTLLAELFQRFIASFPHGENPSLRAAQSLEMQSVPGAKTSFHALTVHGQRGNSYEPLAIILLSSPVLSVDDARILDFGVRRAQAHKVPYFVTWNLRDCILWQTPKPGTLVSRDHLSRLRDYPDLYEVGLTDDQVITELTKIKIIDRGKHILRDLERLAKDESLELVEIDATYFVGRLLEAVHQLVPKLTDSLHHRMQTEPKFRATIEQWALRHSIAGSATETDFAKAIARQIIYRLLGKILFYQSLRRSAQTLPKLDFHGIDSAQVLPTLRTAFVEALKLDYHAVFEEDLPDTIQWPAEASQTLALLVNDFNTRDFAHLPQDVVGTVFERLIPPEERHGLGQYFTSENLCDFIAAFCIQRPEDKVCDPTCGTGTFLIRAYDRLRWLGRHDHVALLSQLWGVDIAPFPAELATINLFRQRIAEHGNFPRIICQDFFRVSPGDRFPFPPPKVDLDHPETIEEQIPEFDAILGNFPYVSADQIEKFESDYLKVLRNCLLDGWLNSYPELFFCKNTRQQQVYEILLARGEKLSSVRDHLQHRISTYADLYVHLFFHTARFLKPGGRMGIITSNAWLDVNYGYELQRFFLKHFKIVAILESRCEPWFIEASVNTVVTILERCDSVDERDANLVRFVKVKRPLEELMPEDSKIEALKRWQNLSRLADSIERAGSKHLNAHHLGMVTEEDQNFRIRILQQGELRVEVEREGKTVKWGQYLRAPQVYFDILQNGKLCLLREIATPKFGSKTRINEFFHVTPEIAAEFGIEEEYLWPLIKSPKDTKTIIVDPSDLKLRIFVCRRSKEELKELGHLGTLNYIDWGEKQAYSRGAFKGMPWPEGTWLKEREPGWWALPKNETNEGHIFFSQALGESHFHRFSPVPLIPDARLYYLQPLHGMKTKTLAASLNSSVTALITEIAGRVTMGDGVLELKVEDARDYLYVPDMRVFSRNGELEIGHFFEKLASRSVGSTLTEIQRSDRRALDSAILEGIGLYPKDYLEPLYQGLCELIRERIELGQMRSKTRKTRARGDRAEKKVADLVLDEVLPEGPKLFPDDFFSPAAATGPKIAVELPEAPLAFNGITVQDKSFKHQVKTAIEARYLIYAQKTGEKIAYLPQKTVELTRTVANYEKYLRDLRNELYEAYYRHTLDTKVASRLTQAAFTKFKLPTPER